MGAVLKAQNSKKVLKNAQDYCWKGIIFCSAKNTQKVKTTTRKSPIVQENPKADLLAKRFFQSEKFVKH